MQRRSFEGLRDRARPRSLRMGDSLRLLDADPDDIQSRALEHALLWASRATCFVPSWPLSCPTRRLEVSRQKDALSWPIEAARRVAANDQRRSGESRTKPNARAPTPPQFASQLLLEVLVQRRRRLAVTTNASFCSRVNCFTTYSRASAFPTERNAS